MILYHYCSNAALVSTIQNRRIRLSELSLSNDYMEGKWVKNILRIACERRNLSKADTSRILELFDVLGQIANGLGYCLSTEADLLSQWVAYAENGSGVSIGFDKAYFEELAVTHREKEPSFSIENIIYAEEQQIEKLKPHVDEFEKLVREGAFRFAGLLASDEDKEKYKAAYEKLSRGMLHLFPYLYTFKNPAFKEEKEWRLLSYRIGDDNQGLEYRAAGDRVVPYREFELVDRKQPSVTEVWLGPSNRTPEKIVSGLLEKYGFKNVSVKISTASYRQNSP